MSRFLWFFCRHKWLTIASTDVVSDGEGSTPIGSVITQQCEHCGKLAFRKMKW